MFFFPEKNANDLETLLLKKLKKKRQRQLDLFVVIVVEKRMHRYRSNCSVGENEINQSDNRKLIDGNASKVFWS